MNPYSDTKVLYHIDKLAAMRRGEQIVPSQVQLILSDLCNHDCGFCAYRMTGYASNQHFGETRANGTINNNPTRFIEKKKAFAILEDASDMGVKAIQFTGGGEPTVHPDHLDIFARALDLGLECALVTNGCILRPGWEKILPRFAWVRVSLDAGTAATYAKIRRVKPAMFKTACENLSRLAAAGVQSLGVSFVITKENADEIVTAAATAHAYGASYIRFAAFFSQDRDRYYSDDLRRRVASGIARAKEEAASADPSCPRPFLVIDMYDQRLHDLASKPEVAFCGYQQFNAFIGADLNVYRCCDTAYNDRGLTGSLKDQGLAQFWKSPEKEKAYREFDARGCDLCAFNGKNRLINAIVNETPLHANFV